MKLGSSEQDLQSLYNSPVNTPYAGAVGIFDFRLGRETTLKEKSLRLSYRLVVNPLFFTTISRSKNVDLNLSSSLVHTICNSSGYISLEMILAISLVQFGRVLKFTNNIVFIGNTRGNCCHTRTRKDLQPGEHNISTCF